VAELDLPAFGDIILYDQPVGGDGPGSEQLHERRFAAIGELENGEFSIMLCGELEPGSSTIRVVSPVVGVPSAMLRRDGKTWRLDPKFRAEPKRILTRG
jgi:hypothetical protein